MSGRKAQASFEYMILLAVFFVILAIVLTYATGEVDKYVKQSEADGSVQTIAKAADQVAAIGPGTVKIIQTRNPNGIVQTYTGMREIVFKQENYAGASDLHYNTRPYVFGFLEAGKGNKFTVLRMEDNGFVSMNPLRSPNLTYKMIFYYNFERTNSTHVYDISGNNNHGTLKGNLMCRNESYIGYGCSMDGIDDYIDVGRPDIDHKSFTFASWVNTNRQNNLWGYELFGWDNYPTCGLDFGVRGDQIAVADMIGKFGIWTDPGGETQGSKINLGVWNHMALTYNSDSRILMGYLNGYPNFNRTNYNGITQCPENLAIGHSAGNVGFINGTVDEVALWNRALSSSEIEELYLSGRVR